MSSREYCERACGNGKVKQFTPAGNSLYVPECVCVGSDELDGMITCPRQPQAGASDTLTPGAVWSTPGKDGVRVAPGTLPGVTPDPDSRALACNPHAGRRALVLAAQAQAEAMGLYEADEVPR